MWGYAGCNNIGLGEGMCVYVNFQIKTKQVFRQLLQTLPGVRGKKAIYVPHLFQILILYCRWRPRYVVQVITV